MSEETNQTIQGSPKEHLNENAAIEYWTEERIRAVKPIPLGREPEGKAHAAIAPAGEAGHLPASRGTADEHAQPHGVLGLNNAGGAAVPSPLAYPFRTCGRLFFNQGSGGFSGSAALISPNVLLTAGHCVFNSGVWSTNMVFYPSYGSRAGNDPNYKFACGRLGAFTSWTTSGDRGHDYGMVWIGSNPAPGNALGWLGLLWNASTAGRIFDVLGYPAEPAPFNGSVMDGAEGVYTPSSTANTIGFSVDHMGHGCSGGPWVTSFNNENPPVHVNSVSSYIVTDPPQVLYGPTFTADVQTLFNWINNPANH